ncbi:unnamed protein product [Candida verbasci]|uniref:Nitronate monooxygenase domain-containing protein n=1 Tax=Candida verbasci TaxID=1227364 RepID=A0A9W4XC62_9ASCO|nr:unnamed protein product [Candida verbasci]
MTSLQLTKKLGIKYPILQAPMAGVSTIEMANNVTKYGGLGAIPLSTYDISTPASISSIKSQLSKYEYNNQVNLNFFSHSIAQPPSSSQISTFQNLYSMTLNSKLPDINYNRNANVSFHQIHNLVIEFVIDFKPAILSFHFGPPKKELIQKFQENGSMVFVTATSLSEAKYLNKLHVDGIILQGNEAGGHRGNFLDEKDEHLSTKDLFEQVIKEFKKSPTTFIIVSGGIYNSQQVKEYIDNGASGIQLGTVFLNTPESNNHQFFKDKHDEDTVMTDLISGRRARAVKTPFINDIIKNYNGDALPDYGYRYNSYKELKKKQVKKDVDIGFYLAGENYKLCNREASIQEIMENITKDL